MDTISNIVSMMSSKWCFEVKNLRCDVTYHAHDATHMASVMSQKEWCDVCYTVVVMTKIVTVMSHVKCICCPHTGCGFMYRVCVVIGTVE